MKYENIKIITGSPEEVAEAAQQYLNEHPNAQILSTAVTMKRGQPIKQAEAHIENAPSDQKDKPALKPAKKAAKASAAPTADSAPEATADHEAAPGDVVTLLRAIEYGPDEPIAMLTLGRVF